MSKKPSLSKADNPSQYAKLANEGILLGYPVKIGGQQARSDNGIHYHSTIKYFDKDKDHPHAIHGLAQHLPLNPPDAKNTQIGFDTFKDRFGNDVNVVTLHGNSADKLKEHNGKFAHMGFPSKFEWTPHISVDRETFDKLKSSGAKTAHEAGIEFGPAQLKKGPSILKTYHHQPDSAEPKVPDEGDMTAKATAKSEDVLGNKPLMKPYVSEAQRRWAHTPSGKKALGGNAGVHEWDQATKGRKLPEKVGKSEKSKVCLSHKDFVEEHKDLVDTLKHPTKEKTKKEIKEQSEELKEQSLEKGALKNAGIALGMAGALAGSATNTDAGNRSTASIPHHSAQAPSYDHQKMLRAIADVESSGGKNTKHAAGGGPIHGTEHAYGKFGLMPETIRETIKGHKDLKSKHGRALALSGQQLHKYMQDHKGLEDIVADRHLAHMEHVLGQNTDHLAYGWLNGMQGTLNAKKNKEDIANHWHVQKVRDAYNKGSKL